MEEQEAVESRLLVSCNHKDSKYCRLHKEQPFLNPTIMSNIFKQLESKATVEDLRKLRSVCRLWYEESLPMWRLTAALKLGPPGTSIDTRSRTAQADGYLPVNNFLALTQDKNDPYKLKTLPYSKYVLYGINFNKIPRALCLFRNGRDRTNNLWMLLQSLGLQMKTFKFENCVFHYDHFELFEKIVTQHLRNIKELTLSKNKIMGEVQSDNVMIQIRQRVLQSEYNPTNRNLRKLTVDGDSPMPAYTLIRNAPNLEALKIRDNDVSLYTDYSFWSFPFIQLRMNRSGYNFRVKELDVMDSSFFAESSPTIHGLLETLNWPLESLSLNLEPHPRFTEDNRKFFFGYETSVDIMNVFLPLMQRYQNTLKVLKIFRPPIYRTFTDMLASFELVLPKLEELHVLGNLFDEYSFLKSTPKLKILHIDFACYEKVDQFEKYYYPAKEAEEMERFRERYSPFGLDPLMNTRYSVQSTLRLPHLEILHLDCVVSAKAVKLFEHWMPSLKVLRGNVNTESLRTVFKCLTNLEELVLLYRSNFTEEALTGRGRLGADCSFNPDNITCLKRLKRFQNKGRCGGQGVISDHSVTYGFLKMPSLEAVNISVSKYFSPKSEELLKEHVSDVTIIRNYRRAKETSHGDMECCRRRAFNVKVLKRTAR